MTPTASGEVPTASEERRAALSPRVVWLLFAAATAALVGVYWDGAWHTDRGRDSLLSPPHIALYLSAASIGLGVVLWALRLWRSERSVRGVLTYPPLALALAGDAVALLSAPIDDAWHRAFARDAVTWSPPHMFALVGVIMVACGVLLGVAETRGRLREPFVVIASAFVLGTFLVTVGEYEEDVPQFAILWYLPLVAGEAALAFGMARGFARGRWPATASAVVYTVLRAAILAFLALLGHSLLPVTPIVVPALVFDLTFQRGWSPSARAAAFAAAVFGAYVPYFNWALDGLHFSALDVVLGVPLAILLAWIGLAIVEPQRRPLVARVAVAVLVVVVLAAPDRALAHDPGQGAPFAEARLVAQRSGFEARTAVRLVYDRCADVVPVGTIARRAGRVETGPLRRIQGCDFAGAVELPDRGRWFVYVEFETPRGAVEAWLPVRVDAGSATFTRSTLAYFPNASPNSFVKIVGGAALYAVNLALLGVTFGVVRRRGGEGRAARSPLSTSVSTL